MLPSIDDRLLIEVIRALPLESLNQTIFNVTVQINLLARLEASGLNS